jgi:hypothetical protein
MTDKREGYSGSGDGPSMPPPPLDPSGSPPPEAFEAGKPTPYDAGLREGFRRALEGEAPWWPIPGNPTGEYRGFNVERPPPEPREPASDGSGMVGEPEDALRPAEAAREPGTGDISDAYGWPAAERYPATEWFKAELRETRSSHRTIALQAAAELVGLASELVPRTDLGDLAGKVLEVAETFEGYLAGGEQPAE